MPDSILQVNTIKDKGGNATGITVADSSANVTINNLTSSTGFPAGHVVRTTSVSSMSQSGHINTTSQSIGASGIIVDPPATTGNNYNLITMSMSGYIASNGGITIYLYVEYNGTGGYSLLGGTTSPHFRKNQTHGNHYNHHKTWVDTNTGNMSTGSGAKYQLYYASTNSSTAYLVHNGTPYIFMVQEIKA